MPDLFLSVKLIHIMAMIVMVGATIINGVIHSHARASTPVEAAALLKVVTRINAVFMGPSLLVIPASGILMMVLLGYDWRAGWLLSSITLTLALLVAFVVGDRVERDLHVIASNASAAAQPSLPDLYQTTFAKAAPIGGAALMMSLITLILMIFKPF